MRILSTSEQTLAGLEPIAHPDQLAQYLTVLTGIDRNAFDSNVGEWMRDRARDNFLIRLFHGDMLKWGTRHYPQVGPAPDFQTKDEWQYYFYYRIPIRYLLSPTQVQSYGLTPRPGYLYLAVPAPEQGWLSRHDIHHFRSEDRGDDKWRFTYEHVEVPNKENHFLVRFASLPSCSGAMLDVRMMLNARELTWDNSPHLRENIGLEYSIDQRISDKHTREWAESRLREINWLHAPKIVETPFEFPHGFVRETVRNLARDLHRSAHPFVESLEQLVLGECPVQENEEDVAEFPFSEPRYLGPDKSWRYCDQPWWVQNFLLARLIGGSMWENVLGSFEAWLQNPIEWDTELKVPTNETTSPKRATRKNSGRKLATES